MSIESAPSCPPTGSTDDFKDMPLCPKGSDCPLITEIHLTCFRHPDITYPRPDCPAGPECRDYSVPHRKALRHGPWHLPRIPYTGVNVHDPMHPDVFDEDVVSKFRVDFEQNLSDLRRKLLIFMQKHGLKKSLPPHFPEIEHWFGSLRPMHMCSADVFKSVVRLSMLKSLNGLQESWFHPEEIADAVMGRADLRPLFEKIDVEEKSDFRLRFLIPYVKIRQGDWDFSDFKEPVSEEGEDKEVPSLKKLAEERIMKATDNEKRENDCIKCEYYSRFGEELVNRVMEAVDETLRHIMDMCSGKLGLAVQSDVDVRTNYSVFSIVGPHLGTYGKSEVVLVMRPEVMCHPDFNMTMYAASGYCARKDPWYHAGYGDNRTEWMGGMTEDRDESRRVLCKEKYTGASPTWSSVAALEWICRVYWHSHNKEGKLYRKTGPIELNDVTLDHVKTLFLCFSDWGTHTLVEGHIPNAMPLEYVEGILLKRSALETLGKDPVAGPFLMRFKNAGKPFLTLVPDDTKKMWSAVFYYLDQVANVNKSYGFSFFIPQETTNEICIPLHLSARKAMITFCVVGGPFSLLLSNFPDLGDPKEKEKKQLKITFNQEHGTIEGYKLVKDGFESKLERVSSGVIMKSGAVIRSSDPVYWGFFIDYDKNVIYVKFIGASGVYGTDEIAIDMGGDGEELGYISMLPNGKDVSVWNLYYYTNQFESFFPGRK